LVQIDGRGAPGPSKGVPGSISGLKPPKTGQKNPKIFENFPFFTPPLIAPPLRALLIQLAKRAARIVAPLADQRRKTYPPRAHSEMASPGVLKKDPGPLLKDPGAFRSKSCQNPAEIPSKSGQNPVKILFFKHFFVPFFYPLFTPLFRTGPNFSSRSAQRKSSLRWRTSVAPLADQRPSPQRNSIVRGP